MNRYKGTHVLCDFINFFGDEYVLGEKIFSIMIEGVNTTNMKIVHQKLSILNENTPAGFTGVLLLDESHFTCHSYTSSGLLALDLFTCGNTDTNSVMEYVKNRLLKEFPDIKCTYLKGHNRFNY
jgi:S-adenosylmethionine decarboxylase